MKIKAQLMLRVDLLEDNRAYVGIWHGEYYRENRITDYRLVKSFTCSQSKLQDFGIPLPVQDK